MLIYVFTVLFYAFLIVMLLIYALFYRTCDYVMCVKCFSVDICIYSIILCFSDCHVINICIIL